MRMRSLIGLLVLLLAACANATVSGLPELLTLSPDKPNFLFFVTDN